jgi:hypothetical protein
LRGTVRSEGLSGAQSVDIRVREYEHQKQDKARTPLEASRSSRVDRGHKAPAFILPSGVFAARPEPGPKNVGHASYFLSCAGACRTPSCHVGHCIAAMNRPHERERAPVGVEMPVFIVAQYGHHLCFTAILLLRILTMPTGSAHLQAGTEALEAVDGGASVNTRRQRTQSESPSAISSVPVCVHTVITVFY